MKVQYAYSLLSGGANHSRLTSMTYPDGRILRYEYVSGIDDDISRLSYLADDLGGSVGTHLEELSYLGLGTIIQRAHPESGVDLTYIGTSPGEAGDQYVGLDRFGRIIDQNWTDGTTDVDRYQYGYDRDSNRLYKKNTVNTSLSELYHANGASNGYDSLNRLTDFSRGTLSDANSDGVMDTITTASRTQDWTLDALGNWSSSSTDGTSTSRTHDKQNELTQVGSNTLTYDDNGNLTTDEQGHTLTYDAWNRLVSVSDGATTLASYTYDALGRRISETHGSDTSELYYSSQWQVLEEWNSSDTPTAQYVWSPAYVDELIERDSDIADGTLDVGFGDEGQVVTDLGDGWDTLGKIAIQSDGKIVVAGHVGYRSNQDFILVRYNLDGSLDSTFGGGDGIVITDMGSNSDFCRGLIIQPDGKIVLADSSGGDLAVARYNSDGSLDSTFGSGGKVITNLGGADIAQAAAIDANGKIIVAGSSNAGGTYDFVVVRYNADGSLDTSFDSDGIVTTDFNSSSYDKANGVTIQSNGKIVVAGLSGDNFAAARYNTDGSLDTSFDSDGKATTDFGGSEIGYDVSIQDDGKIIVAGQSDTVATGNDFAMARYNANGSLDSTFDSDGLITMDTGGRFDLCRGLVIQSDGKIVLVGEDIGITGDYILARYNSDGSLDNSFDGDGILFIAPGAAGIDSNTTVAIQPDGKLVLGCAVGFDFNLVRVNSGPLDQRLYAAQDANHNVTALIDTAGNVVERYHYLPYGEVTVYDGDWTVDTDGISDYAWRNLFQGLRYDSQVGLYDVRERQGYSPTLGRFIQRDPIGTPNMIVSDDIIYSAVQHAQRRTAVIFGKSHKNDSWLWSHMVSASTYEFVTSNPISRNDPSGLDVWIEDQGGPHERLGVGNPNGACSLYSFGLNSYWDVFNPWAQGVVYIDFRTGPVAIHDRIPMTPKQDAEFNNIMTTLVGMKFTYRLTYPNCRTFCNDMHDLAKKSYGK